MTESQFDKQLDKIRKDKTIKLKTPKSKKEDAKMKNVKEIKQWQYNLMKWSLMAIIATIIACAIFYAGHQAGERDYKNHQKAIASEAAKLASTSKANQ